MEGLERQNAELRRANKEQQTSLKKLKKAHSRLIEHAEKLKREATSLAPQLQRMSHNYAVSRQILLDTLAVKLEYEAVIRTALQSEQIKTEMLNIINNCNYKNDEMSSKSDDTLVASTRERVKAKVINDRNHTRSFDPTLASLLHDSLERGIFPHENRCDIQVTDTRSARKAP